MAINGVYIKNWIVLNPRHRIIILNISIYAILFPYWCI